MSSKEQELDNMLRIQQRNQLSSEQELEESREQIGSKNNFRKPIKNAFSDDDDDDSDLEQNLTTGTPFPPKPPQQTRTILQQVQEQMKWDKTQQLETEILARLEGQGMKDKKIRELASKYKGLNVAYEKEKTLRKSLQTQLNSIMKTNDDLNKSTVEKKKQKSMEKSTVSKGNCSNCQQNEKKCMEFRLKSQNMKTELNKAMRVISRQLGQNFNVDQVLNEQNGWKGRQQKIEKLKARVRQLEDKLQNNGVNVSHMSGFTQVTNRTTAQMSSTRTSAMMAQNKRKELDNLKVQVEALKNENELLQGKVKSLTSRKVILENQMKELKNDFEKKRQILMEKSDNDDKFISLLKNENEKLKKQEKVITKVIYKDDGGNSGEVERLKKQNELLKRKLKSAMQVQNKQSGNEPKKVSKDLNSVRVVSAEKKKQLQQEYLKGDKYLKKMTAQDEQELYRNWKNSINSKN